MNRKEIALQLIDEEIKAMNKTIELLTLYVAPMVQDKTDTLIKTIVASAKQIGYQWSVFDASE